MRPLRLELEGFTSFRERTEVVFGDAELFVFTGATGSGKSSLIDAVVFALYGSVPRYDHKGLVSPLISQSKNEARVQLDFEAGDKTYTAVRIVRRTAGGASTKEATLEQWGTEKERRTLARTTDDLNNHIKHHVVGLELEQFTKCVVLPQGEFAAFMREKPAERGKLLDQLLGVGLYKQLGQAATRLGKEQRLKAETLGRRLEGDLADATAGAVRAAETEVAALGALSGRIEEAAPRLRALSKAAGGSAAAAEEAGRWLKLLGGVRPPPGTLELEEEWRSAKNEADKASRDLEKAIEHRRDAASVLEKLPDRTALVGIRDRREQLEKLRAQVEETTRGLAVAEQEVEAAGGALRLAEEDLQAKRARLADLRLKRGAAHLARYLVPGQDCPVCLQEVVELPRHGDLTALEEAEAGVTHAEQKLETARTNHQEAQLRRGNEETRLNERTKSAGDLEQTLKGAPRPDQVTEQLELVDVAKKERDAAASAEKDAQEKAKSARKTVDKLKERRSRAWGRFRERRDTVASLKPPGEAEGDLAGSWRELCDWAEASADEQRAARTDAENERSTAEGTRQRIEQRLADQCREAGLELEPGGEPAGACATALVRASTQLDGLRRRHEERARVARERDDLVRGATLAGELGNHLDAKHFGGWMQNQILQLLIAGATEKLKELSNGDYSLSLDEKNEFLVIDHRNADEPRPAKTLSGGETFLASLALALSLAGQVAGLAARGSPRLEALFLDEGFGALDPEALEIVADTIEQLGSERTVGLVTHVAELANRIPVQFRVKKAGNSSSVERVEI
ncbi:MAG: SMC family ATPase [Gemmatimonadetes bacterium]|nr:SMC family ATPase [Gemmatimonadota bacterium]